MAKLTDVSKNAAQIVEPVEVIFNLLPASDATETTLAKLVPLDATPIKFSSYAMRELNDANLANIAAAIENDAELPPLKVVNTNLGFVVIDGYHRWTAYEQHLAQVLADSSEGEVTEEQASKDFETARTQYPVSITQLEFSDGRQVIDAAFKANLEHGLAASESSRSRYALWLLEMNRADLKPGEKAMSVREAARRALVSHVAVLKAAKKIAKQMKMVDGAPLEADELAEADSLQAPVMDATQKQVDALDRAIQSIAKAVTVFKSQEISDIDLEAICAQTVGEMKNFYREDVPAISKVLNYMFKAAKNRPIAEVKEVAAEVPQA